MNIYSNTYLMNVTVLEVCTVHLDIRYWYLCAILALTCTLLFYVHVLLNINI
jgi:hypothetical protein